MAEFVHEFSTRVADDDGTRYAARAYAQERADGTWAGWLEFHPAAGGGAPLKTEQETSQPNRMTIEYWASGLEPIYLEGAFVRARRHSSKTLKSSAGPLYERRTPNPNSEPNVNTNREWRRQKGERQFIRSSIVST